MRIGCAINWAKAVNRWQIYATRHIYEEIFNRFHPVILCNQNDYDQYAGDFDIVLQCEPRTAGGPEIHYNGKHPVIAHVSDPHSKGDWLLEYFQSHRIDYVLSPYHSAFFYQFPFFDPANFLPFWWAVDKTAINSRNLQVRSDRVTIWGATGRYYALREWCGTLPGVDVYPREIAGHNATSSQYYRRITDFDAAICAVSEDSCVLYPVAKINEIAAAGALLFVQEMPDLALYGWNETNCVPFTRETLPEKLQEYRRNPELYLPIREAGRQLVIERHTVERRIDELEGFISILSK